MFFALVHGVHIWQKYHIKITSNVHFVVCVVFAYVARTTNFPKKCFSSKVMQTDKKTCVIKSCNEYSYYTFTYDNFQYNTILEYNIYVHQIFTVIALIITMQSVSSTKTIWKITWQITSKMHFCLVSLLQAVQICTKLCFWYIHTKLHRKNAYV